MQYARMGKPGCPPADDWFVSEKNSGTDRASFSERAAAAAGVVEVRLSVRAEETNHRALVRVGRDVGSVGIGADVAAGSFARAAAPGVVDERLATRLAQEEDGRALLRAAA